MATTIDPARLYAILMNTGLQNKDQPLYQVIHDLIATLVSVNTQVATLLSNIAPSSIPSSPSGSKTTQIISSFEDGSDDFFSGMIIPGNVGAIGQQGLQGIQGEDGINGEDSYIPGPQGATGIAGVQGTAGIPGLDGDSFDNYPIDFPLKQDFIGIITDTQNGLAVTSTDGFLIKNDTLSTAGVPVQMSPRIRLRAHVWNTTTPADNTDDWWLEDLPGTGAAPLGLLNFTHSANGAASVIALALDATGSGNFLKDLRVGGNLNTVGSINLANAGQLYFLTRTQFNSTGNGLLNIATNNQSIGIGFDVTTDSTIKIRTRAQTGDGSLTALNITTSGTLIDKSYNIAAPVTLGTVVMSAGQQRQIINPAGTLAVLTVTLPSSPVDGQIAGISFTQAITSLTINAPGGATVVAPLTAAAIDTSIRFIYQASSTSWFPAG